MRLDRVFAFAALLGSVSTEAISYARDWDPSSNPDKLNSKYIKKIELLPVSGTLPSSKIPWADSHWPYYQNGIANRWQSGHESPATPGVLKLLSREQVFALSPAELARLSPSEKYDILRGRFDYPLTHEVLGFSKKLFPFGNENQGTWSGICHGWSMASILLPEPAPRTLMSSDGISVPFQTSDLGAIYSFFYGAEGIRDNVALIGNRCRHGLYFEPCHMNAVNAGAFHVALTNQIGLLHESFVVNVNLDYPYEIWNRPVYAYESKVLKNESQRVLFETRVLYTKESDPHLNRVSGTPNFSSFSQTYRYWVEFNQSHEVTGGSWDSENEPMFVWKLKKDIYPNRDFSHVLDDVRGVPEVKDENF